MELLFWVLGAIFVVFIVGALQRIFFPQTLINGFMDSDKVQNIYPEIFENRQEKNKEKKND